MTTTWRSLALATASVAALAGCASLNTVHSDVTSFGQWPTGRPPGTYTIERLPSQQSNPRWQAVEAAAATGLEEAGFKPAPDAATADVVVQIGARITRTDLNPWNDPLWWRWGPSYWHHPGWYGHGWAWPPYYYDNPQFDREVGLLIRDRSSGTPLYEARAATSGTTEGNDAIMRAMFEAAMKDFPNAVPKPHDVGVSLNAANGGQ
jgi:hypothetical protein